MPAGEPGGPDSEVFYDFGTELKIHENSPFKNEKCHVNCDCGRYIEIANSVFMQYQKQGDGSFAELPQKNVDFGGGLERFLLAVENQPDVFKTSLFRPIIKSIESISGKRYDESEKEMRIITDHFIAAVMISSNGIYPSNKEQGYILRRLIRRGLDNVYALGGKDITLILERIVEQYKLTDEVLVEKYEFIKNTLLEEEQKYGRARNEAKKFIQKRYKQGDELKGITEISAEDAFTLYTTHGLSPTQIKSLGYTFDDQAFAQKMEEHQKLSREGAKQKFAGGLADHQEKTIMGHTATHLMHQAIRDLLGTAVHQSGSNITTERVRFDYNFDRKLTSEEVQKIEDTVNQKIKENLPVHFEMIDTKEAHTLGAIGLFMDTYGEKSKIYFIGGPNPHSEKERAYSIEFCGGPHVEFTGRLKRFKIIKEEGLGKGMRRIYAKVE